MVILRPTQKLRPLLPINAPPSAESDTALGDWYINRMVVDRRPLLLIVSAKSLLTLLIPARDVRTIPQQLPTLVATRLRRLGIAQQLIESEIAVMNTVAIAPTRDRSVLGVLVDTAKTVPYHLDAGRWDDTTLPFVENQLAQTPWIGKRRSADVLWPERAAPQLLFEKWGH